MVVFTKPTVLNMNGKKIISAVSADNGYNKAAILVKAQLTIGSKSGETAVSGAEIYKDSTSIQDPGCLVYVTDGDLTINDGVHLYYAKAVNKGTQFAIRVESSGAANASASATINDAVIDHTTYGIVVYRKAALVVNGGTIKSDTEAPGDPNFAIGGNGLDGWGDTTITINGGTFDGLIDVAVYSTNVSNAGKTFTIDIQGGSFTDLPQKTSDEGENLIENNTSSGKKIIKVAEGLTAVNK